MQAKSLIMTAAAALMLFAGNAQADLGDTYAQDCAAYGGRGTVDKKNHCIFWHVSKHYIVESFVKNKCAMMCVVPANSGDYYTIAQAQEILSHNIGPNQLWQPYDAGSGFIQAWATSDKSIYAALFANGSLRVCFTWWLQGKGLYLPPAASNYGEAPVEDVPNTDGNQI